MTPDEHARRRDSLTELDFATWERMTGLDEPVSRADWGDVRRRSRSVARAHALRVAAVVGAVLTVLVLGGVLVYLLPDGSRSVATSPAVWQNFSRFARATPPSMQAPAIVSQARLVTSTSLNVGRRTLYVAPSRDGGFCYEWTGGAKGCDQLRQTPFTVTWVGNEIVGIVSAAEVSSVKITLTGGTTVQPQISWISAPIGAGFFLYDIPRGKTVLGVDAFDAGEPQGRVTWFST